MVSANFASAGEHLPNMSQLARAFTTIGRRNKRSVDDDVSSSSSSSSPFIGRAASQRGGRIVNLTDISSPLALMSTSNMQVHNAKHIAGTNAIAIHHVGTGPASSSSSSSSSVSGDESDNATVLSGQDGGALTDASSVDESPMLEPNHLSCYFKPTVNTTGSGLRRSRSSTLSSTGYGAAAASAPSSPTLSETAEETFGSNSADSTPRIPQRVPSHSKRAHERVHRTRSLQRSISVVAGTSTPSSPGRRSGLGRSSSTNSMRASSATTTSSSSILALADPSKASQAQIGTSSTLPSLFGNELSQLDEEVAEEFDFVTRKVEAEMAAEAAEDAAERAQMAERGLAVWDADVYCGEIAELVEETFGVWAGHVDVGVVEVERTWF